MDPSKKYILVDRKPVEVGLEEWSRWLEDGDNKRVTLTEGLRGGRWVSTVFLGLDHNWSDTGPPLLFETMVFSKPGSFQEEECIRTPTWEEAERAHEAMVEKFKPLPPGKGLARKPER
jgi:hypothetical protein